MTQLDLFDALESRPRLNPTVAEHDVPRLTASLQRLLEHMRDGAWHTGPSLIPVAGLRYSARLNELARAGYPHERQHVGGGVHRYRLIGRFDLNMKGQA